jgi:TfoX/Sxy family transcriptional regulator of competence genes
MTNDDAVTVQIRELLRGYPDFVEKRMFGGIGFMLRGNMACGINKGNLIVRVGPDRYEAVLQRPHAKVFDMTGKAMKGWISIGPKGYRNEADLKDWVQMGVDFALSLPPK